MSLIIIIICSALSGSFCCIFSFMCTVSRMYYSTSGYSSSSRYNNDDNGREQTFYDEFRPRPGDSRPRSVDIRPKLAVQNRIRTTPFVAQREVDTRFVKSSPPPVEDDETNYRAMLEELNPSSTFLVELPFSGNGNLYQVRTTISNEVFYGRAETEEEAIAKCCKKATRFILQRDLNSTMVEKVRTYCYPSLWLFQKQNQSWPSYVLGELKYFLQFRY